MTLARRRLTCAALFALAAIAAGPSARAECPRDFAADAYADARRAFVEKRFDDSVVLLRKVYACDPQPVYLGNVARTYEEANRPRDALAAWREYLAVISDEREKTVTEGRISALTKIVDDLDRLEREKQAAIEGQRKAEAETRERRRQSSTEPPPSRRVPIAAWVTAAGGALGLVTGGVLGIVAESRHDAAVRDPNVDSAEEAQHDARSLARAASWAFAIGGAVTAIGGAWIAIDLLRPPVTSLAPSAALLVRGTDLVMTGSF